MNPHWQKSVICADSHDIIKRIPDNSIDLILTDPPYNIGKHSTGNIPLPGRSAMNNDVADWDWVDFNPEEWADEFVRILKPTGNLFIFTSYNQLGRWYDCLDHKFDTSNFMIWHKTNPAPKIFKAGFLNSCEMIYTCWNKKHTWNFISQRDMHNFMESPICMAPERLREPKHPAQKPVAILKKIIRIASNANDIVFDPFFGVGSTGVAAIEEGRKIIGVEINPAYQKAANDRVNKAIMKRNTENTNEEAFASEPSVQSEALWIWNLEKLNRNKEISASLTIPIHEGFLKPIIKWPGGKEKELAQILPNTPQNIKNYYEPFVGGGSVFMAVSAQNYYINDKSDELIELYNNIAKSDTKFFSYAESIEKAWQDIHSFATQSRTLVDLYKKFREDAIDKVALKKYVSSFCKEQEVQLLSIINEFPSIFDNVFFSEIKKNLSRKMERMKVLEQERHILPETDLYDNVECALKSSLYMYFRYMYNDETIRNNDVKLHCALFFFIRNYCYSGMFRYNDSGEFNVPYGGIAYNSKSMSKKIAYYKSEALNRKFSNTTIFNLDFEEFMKSQVLSEEDFVFLDPPYDTEFSTYAMNEFQKSDQQRLASFMINECKAKWMLVIKNTEFIYGLYNREGINIRAFDKKYTVSFMNRNDKNVKHLIITNY